MKIISLVLHSFAWWCVISAAAGTVFGTVRHRLARRDDLMAVADAVAEPVELVEVSPRPWEVTRAVRHAFQQGWISELCAVEQIHHATNQRFSDPQALRILHHGEQTNAS